MVHLSAPHTNIKTIFLTGCDSGIGQFLAIELLKKGNRVIGTFKKSVLEIDDFFKTSLNFFPIKVDFNDSDYIQTITNELNRINIFEVDCLINNAGVAYSATIYTQSDAQIQEMFNVNIVAMIKITRLLLNYLKPDQGRIINVSSFNGKIGFPFMSVYCSTKYAVEGFTESIRQELKMKDIKVILVRPGYIKTAIWKKHYNQDDVVKVQNNDEYKFQLFLNLLTKVSSSVDVVYPAFEKAIFLKNPPAELNVFKKYQYVLLMINFISHKLFNLIIKKVLN